MFPITNQLSMSGRATLPALICLLLAVCDERASAGRPGLRRAR
jgi:hypothetical protein